MRFRRSIPGLTLGVAIMVVMAACSSSSKSSSKTTSTPSTTAASTVTTAGSTSGGGTVQGITDKQIVIGGLSTLAQYGGIDNGAKARYERANREGGINGRMIKFLGVQDDGGDNTKNLTLTRQLVDKDGVFAVAPVATQALLNASTDYFASKQTPFVGWGFMPGFCGNNWAFGFNGCLVGDKEVQGGYLAPIIAASGKQPQDLKFAFQSEDGDAGKTALRDFGTICDKIGCKVVYSKTNIPLSSPTTDYTPYVQAILAAKPDIVFVNVSFTNVIGLTSALAASGYKGMTMNFVSYVPGLLEAQPAVAKALEGTYVNVQIPPSEGESKATTQLAADLTAIGVSPFVSFGASVGYWSADVMVQMLQAAGPNLSPATFDSTINGSFTYKPTDGGIGPVAYPAGHTVPTSCSALVQVKNGKYVLAEPMKCYTNYTR